MRFLADAWESVQRNRQSLLLYVGAFVLLNVLLNVLHLALFGTRPLDEQPPIILWYMLAVGLVYAVVASAVQSIVFARMGEDIDRPVWRCPTDTEALRRFFMPWFLINLTGIAILHFQGVAQRVENQEASLVLSGVFLAAYLFALPVGVCIMYLGRFRWSELGTALRPLVRQFDLAVLVLLLRFVQFTWFMMSYELYVPAHRLEDPGWWTLLQSQVLFLPLANIPIWVMDCLLFAALWRICMINRDQDVEEMDDPFDF